MNNDVLTSISAELISAPKKRWFSVYRGIGLSIIILGIWTVYAELEVMIFGIGKVIPATEVKTIQHLEGGIISEILVKSGQHVNVGDILLRINNVKIDANLGEIQSQLQGINATLTRIQAEVGSQPLVFDADFIKLSPQLAAQELELHAQRQKELNESIQAFRDQLSKNRQEEEELKKQLTLLDRNLKLMGEELKLTQDLVNEGALSKVELSRLTRQFNALEVDRQQTVAAQLDNQNKARRIQQELDERRSGFFSKTMTQRSELEIKKQGLLKQVQAASDQSVRSDVQSPVVGTVKQIFMNTLGGVVQPGMDLLEIVPDNDKLLVETKIKPEDIAFIYQGQQANVRITAYDFSIYGSLPGKVVYIGADTIEEKDGRQFYIVHVQTEESLVSANESFPILPGMIANVDIITGRRTVFNYIAKPITKTTQRALREK